MSQLKAFNLQKWLGENRHLLKPPVGNKLIADGEFKVMVVAGPNARTDYHVEEGEEWFYQLEGEMVLRVVDKGQFYDIPISAGDVFCLPPKIPHSPQRKPQSIGLVVERERRPGEVDALQWYCQNESCRNLLYRKEFFCKSLVDDLPPIISDYYGDEDKRTCHKCGFIEGPPSKPPSQ
ncbi:3-hydroxyanthranilate 3,4-dioxygenase [Gracilariopsis chorda]|uniref:3-hydroxyanthranilate 3,4-dioxygenase n=1 Tax=Gracilariopsis chorda TaxID=448386 RepID=A0A2V3J1Q2_9FLOR|nr:3-hydroxyanthranilate 3,4-dioxygenase [Gracilariopsis chorda]|eukprot:PXF48279.1 3-hydroxyanthranilate 3,4-dioxygenase [Gracilariopsis chorda]